MHRPGPATGTEAGNRKNRFLGLGPRPASSIFQGKQLPGGLLQTPRDEEGNVGSDSVNQAMVSLSSPTDCLLFFNCGPKEAKRRPSALAWSKCPLHVHTPCYIPASSYVPGTAVHSLPLWHPLSQEGGIVEGLPWYLAVLSQDLVFLPLVLVLHFSHTAGNSQFPLSPVYTACEC